MAEARVESIDALKSLKTAMIKFAEGANAALGDSESEVMRVMNWLENEQTSYWQMQHRKRTELVGRCKEQLRMKTIFKDSSGRQQSAVEEQKALKIAMRKLEESEFKITAIRKAIKRLEKEFPLYRGSVQRFATDVVVEVPAAVAHLENMLMSLEAYTALTVPVDVTSTAVSGSDAPIGSEQIGSMARAVDGKKEDDARDEDSAEAGPGPSAPGADAS
jgi:hypothetical protein